MQDVKNPVSFYFFIVHKAFLSFLILTILHFHTIGPTELVGYSEKLGTNTNLSLNGLKGIDIFGCTTVERRLISKILLTQWIFWVLNGFVWLKWVSLTGFYVYGNKHSWPQTTSICNPSSTTLVVSRTCVFDDSVNCFKLYCVGGNWIEPLTSLMGCFIITTLVFWPPYSYCWCA